MANKLCGQAFIRTNTDIVCAKSAGHSDAHKGTHLFKAAGIRCGERNCGYSQTHPIHQPRVCRAVAAG